jgi:hypothetical protein
MREWVRDRMTILRQEREDAEIAARFVCLDCSGDTGLMDEYYMVHDHLWAAAGLRGNDGMLCIGCLEGRLERLLEPKDFTDAPVNHGFTRQSERLLNRLGRAELQEAA